MREILIQSQIRQLAYSLASQRDTIAKSHQRTDGKFHDGYSDLEVNWQGLIAELILKQRYPFWEEAQPLVLDSISTLETDFKCDGLRLEIKCNRFLAMYPVFFINQALFLKKEHLFDKIVCCAINEHPSKADRFYLFGWMNKAEIKMYPVNTSSSSPAFAIPINDIKGIP